MKKAVFTFDDGLRTHFDVVRPLLNKYNFKATFFVTGAKGLWSHIPDMYEDHMTWEEIKILNDEGFEIGNHTWAHKHLPILNEQEIKEEITCLDIKLKEIGIKQPVSFCYPGYYFTDLVIEVLKELQYKLARVGYPKDWNFCPDKREKICYYSGTNKLLINATGILNDVYNYEYFIKDIENTPCDSMPVFVLHGLRKQNRHKTFIDILDYLALNQWELICLRDVF